MANYRLVSNAQFRPFSFEEYIKPYQLYGEAYKEIEQNIVDLETQAGKWDKLANEQTDPRTHATYLAYANELRALAEQLSRYGMSPALRRRAATMKGRYAKEIEPIEIQYAKRDLLRSELHLLLVANGNTLRFDNDFYNVSLDDMLDNPNMSYQMVSGERIMQDAAALVMAYANDLGERTDIVDENGEGKENKWKQKPFLRTETTKGITLEDAEKAIRGDADAKPFLLDIAQKVKDMYKDNPAFDEEWAKPYIAKGIRSGILGKQSTLIGNPEYSNPLQIAGHEETVRSHKASEAIQRESNAIHYKLGMQLLAALKFGLDMELYTKGLKRGKNNTIVPLSATELANNPIYQSNLRASKGNRQASKARGYIGKESYYSVTGSPNNPRSGKNYTFKEIEQGLASGKYHIEAASGPNQLAGKRTLSHYNKGVVDNYMKNHDLNPDDFFYVIPEHKKGEPIDIIIVPYSVMDSTL